MVFNVYAVRLIMLCLPSIIFLANLVGLTILLIMTIVVFCIVVLLWLRVRQVTKGCASDNRQMNINPAIDNNDSAHLQQSIDDETASEAHCYDEINYNERRSKLNDVIL